VPDPTPKKREATNLKSMARAYTDACMKRLGSYVEQPQVPDAIAIEAIKILLDRGYGRPKSKKSQEVTGKDGGPITVEIVYPPRDEK
jgi:hypothetical protein